MIKNDYCKFCNTRAVQSTNETPRFPGTVYSYKYSRYVPVYTVPVLYSYSYIIIMYKDVSPHLRSDP